MREKQLKTHLDKEFLEAVSNTSSETLAVKSDSKNLAILRMMFDELYKTQSKINSRMAAESTAINTFINTVLNEFNKD